MVISRTIAGPFLLFLISPVSGICPQNCSCDNEYQLAVNCDNVKLLYIPSLLHPGTQSLQLLNCQIEQIESDIMELYPDLLHLDLSYNNVSVLQNSIFRYQTKIQNLNLSNNYVKIIYRNSFQGLHSLQKLDLSFNRVQEIESNAFGHVLNLMELNLSYNSLQNLSIAIFDGLTNLRSLIVSRNKIRHLDGSFSTTLPNLRNIDLSQNYITTISPDIFSQSKLVNSIDLSANYIRNIPVFGGDDFAHLEYLNLSFNEIDKIEPYSFRQLRSLLVLDLSGNDLTILPALAFDGLFQLKQLKLSEQRYLRQIQNDAFFGLASLEILNVSHSHGLECIDRNAFEISHALRIFDVSFCALRTIPSTLFDWKRVPELHISGNPFHCDQKLLSFLPGILRLRSITDVVCNTPEEMYNISIATLEIDEVLPEDTKRALIIVCFTLTLLTIIVIIILFLYPKLVESDYRIKKSRNRAAEQRLYQNLMHRNEYIRPECYNSASEFSSSSTSASKNTFVDLFRSRSYYDRMSYRIPTDAVLINDEVFVKQAEFTYVSSR